MPDVVTRRRYARSAVNRNLITRLGTASGIVAALVVLVFGALVQAVRTTDRATDRARAAEQTVERAVTRALGPDAGRPLARPAERAALLAEIRRSRAAAERERDEADRAVHRATVVGITGMVVSTILLFALTSYLTRYIVVPLRRVNRAASDLAEGDLAARVVEQGDAEPVELARSFNAMATNLQATQAALEGQNAALAAEKRRIEVAARVNRAVLDATPDPIGLLDLDGQLVAENASMARIWERHARVDTPGLDPDREVQDEVTFDDRTYRRYAAPVRDSEGGRMGRLVALHDVTSERQSERLKDEFFALVSHELRTPLTSIIGYLELVRDEEDELPEDAQRFLAVVDRNAARLLRLVGDMLFVAQVEAGRIALERTDVPLHEVVADCAEAARPAAERGRIELVVDAETVPPLAGDRDRLGQLVDNLVSNALKFTPEGGTVTLRLRDGGRDAVVEVADDGVGVSKAEQDRLFERFFRSSEAVTRAVPGAGLGLAIVKTIAEGHGGTVSLRSVEGEGTTVTVRLPYDEAAARP